MTRKILTIFVLLGLAVFSGCAKSSDETAAPSSVESASTPAATAKTVDHATAGTLKGRAIFEGSAPAPRELSVRGNPECAVLHAGGSIASDELLVKDGGLKNVFVYVEKGLEDYRFSAPTGPVVIANTKCMYDPHVAGVQVGQPVVLENNDATLHNIHAYAKNSKAFNLGLPFQGMKQTKTFSTPEIMVPLKCDVHPWMLGYLGVVAHPYFAVTDADGNFEIKDLPPGEYTIQAWHEKLGARSQTVRIEPQGTAAAEFKFSANASS